MAFAMMGGIVIGTVLDASVPAGALCRLVPAFPRLRRARNPALDFEARMAR